MNIFKQFTKSLYSPKDMALFRYQGIGKTIGFVFLLMFISSLIISISLGNSFLNFASLAQEKFATDIPDFVLSDGTLQADINKPIINENSDFTFIFDTTGQITINDVSKYQNALALLKKEMIIASESQQPQQIPYSTLGDLKISKEDVTSFVNSLDTIILVFLPIAFIFLYLFTAFMKFIGISFLAVIGLILSTQTNRKLQYRNLWILSAYAVAIPTIFFAIIDALKIFIPFSFLLYWLTATIVLYLIIKEIPKPKSQDIA
ncbi:DUF1189 domain-containing protein [Calidifontibacillus oryziterrae]|uniref:DUF1189 domain-containing protein n=1 Tax=Calidifontibacillus oryziterrae TaxID=1191699 RepID=UPI0002F14358|nr:DUF1189 domain-containing protein [Calidifontibacillus oryziterrae]